MHRPEVTKGLQVAGEAGKQQEGFGVSSATALGLATNHVFVETATQAVW